MGISDRVPKMMEKWARDRADAKDVADALTAVQQFNARTKANLGTVAWPTIAAALLSKHHWAHIHCRTCDAIAEMDLRVKPREGVQPVCIVLSTFRCPRCNGSGRPVLIRLSRFPGPVAGGDQA